MMKKTATLAAAGLLVLSLAACGADSDDEQEYRQACVTQDDQNVVPDENCAQNINGYMWYYYPYGWPIYAPGSHVSGGTTHKPKKVYVPAQPYGPGVKPVAPVKKPTTTTYRNPPARKR
jgi:hypothetical protein